MSNGIKPAVRLESQIRAGEGLGEWGFLVGGDTAVGWRSRRLGKGGQLSLGAGGDIGIKQDVGVEI